MGKQASKQEMEQQSYAHSSSSCDRNFPPYLIRINCDLLALVGMETVNLISERNIAP